MPAIRSSLLVTAACATLAVPAFAAAQTYEVPTSGSGTGYDWTTFPLGPKDSPSTITTAFGLLWLPDSTTGSGHVSTVDPTTGAVTAQYAPVGAPRVSGAAFIAGLEDFSLAYQAAADQRTIVQRLRRAR